MTLVLAVTAPESIWLLSDRRLCSVTGSVVTPCRDDACKVMRLHTTDGAAILGYAGLGATASGTQPSDWMSAVLRGRNLPLDASFGVLTEATCRELPPHLSSLTQKAACGHHVVAPAFLDGKPRCCLIGWESIDGMVTCRRVYIWHKPNGVDIGLPPRWVVGGSGAPYLMRETSWQRPLLRLIRAYEQRRVSAQAVAQVLADLNQRVSLQVTDGTVGPNSIVCWINRVRSKDVPDEGHLMFSGSARERDLPSIPSIGRGQDWHALFSVLASRLLAHMNNGHDPTAFEWPTAEIDALPTTPDERLK